MLNGLTPPMASAAVEEPDAPVSTHHDMGHGTAPEQTPADSEPEAPMTDCCQAGDCGCGCTAPQVSTPRMAVTPRIPAISRAVPVPSRSPHLSDAEGAPFRPPA